MIVLDWKGEYIIDNIDYHFEILNLEHISILIYFLGFMLTFISGLLVNSQTTWLIEFLGLEYLSVDNSACESMYRNLHYR